MQLKIVYVVSGAGGRVLGPFEVPLSHTPGRLKLLVREVCLQAGVAWPCGLKKVNSTRGITSEAQLDEALNTPDSTAFLNLANAVKCRSHPVCPHGNTCLFQHGNVALGVPSKEELCGQGANPESSGKRSRGSRGEKKRGKGVQSKEASSASSSGVANTRQTPGGAGRRPRPPNSAGNSSASSPGVGTPRAARIMDRNGKIKVLKKMLEHILESEEQGILDSNAIFGGPLRENQWQQILFGGAEIEEDIFLEVLDVLDTRTLRDSHEDILLFRSLELFIEYGSFKVKLGAYVRDSVERVLTQRLSVDDQERLEKGCRVMILFFRRLMSSKTCREPLKELYKSSSIPMLMMFGRRGIPSILHEVRDEYERMVCAPLRRAGIASSAEGGSHMWRNMDVGVEGEGVEILQCSVLPTREEIFGQPKELFVELKVNPGITSWSRFESDTDWVSFHFHMLRMDLLMSCRECVDKFRENPNKRHPGLNILPNCFPLGWEVDSTEGLLLQIRVSRVPLRRAKDLKGGSLVAFIPKHNPNHPDREHLHFLAVTPNRVLDQACARRLEGMGSKGVGSGKAQRKNARGKKLKATMERPPKGADILIRVSADPSLLQCHDILQEEFFMVESDSAYFESYRHGLSALQEMRPTDIPLRDILVPSEGMHERIAEESNGQPAYVNSLKPLDLTCLMNPGYQHVLPSIRYMRNTLPAGCMLNESQYLSLYHALHSSVSLIQGPPGTGKTFLGVKLANVLLSNRKTSLPFKGPLVLISYKNHALDQFLEAIGSISGVVYVRIGARSSSDAVQKRTLSELRYQDRAERPKWMKKRLWELRQERDKIAESCRTWLGQSLIEDLANFLLEQSVVENPGVVETAFRDPSFVVHWGSGMEEVEKWIVNSLQDLTISNMDERAAEDEFALADRKMVGDEEIEEDEDEDQFAGSMEGPRGGASSSSVSSMRQEYEELGMESWSLGMILQYLQKNPLKSSKDMWNLPASWRAILFSASRTHEEEVFEQMMELEERRNQIHTEILQLEDTESMEILRTADVVGLTVSGATKYRRLLKSLHPSVVLVEESGEIMESQLIACLPKSVQHLILIGDHKQLKPKISNFNLNKDFGLDVSLFKRLLKYSNLHMEHLGVQFRMHPDIASLTKYRYTFVDDSPNTHVRAPIQGLRSRVFFLDHQHPERGTTSGGSKVNEFEADFSAALAKYLLQQGYRPEEITILAGYKGQVMHIRSVLMRAQIGDVRVSSVDDFQGEENKIIILSLVRNNKDRSLGFLAIANRVTVALSRARDGLYILGCRRLCTSTEKSRKSWRPVFDELDAMHAIGTELCLQCQQHPEQSLFVSKAEHFPEDGGCTLPCRAVKPCGHVCLRMCHPDDRDHRHPCREECARVSPLCPDGHRCQYKCGDPCGPCGIKITLVLPCGHRFRTPCHLRGKDHKCKERCPNILSCGHQCTEKCSDPCICNVKVHYIQPICEHTNEVFCSKLLEAQQGLCSTRSCDSGFKKLLAMRHSENTCAAMFDLVCKYSRDKKLHTLLEKIQKRVNDEFRATLKFLKNQGDKLLSDITKQLNRAENEEDLLRCQEGIIDSEACLYHGIEDALSEFFPQLQAYFHDSFPADFLSQAQEKLSQLEGIWNIDHKEIRQLKKKLSNEREKLAKRVDARLVEVIRARKAAADSSSQRKVQAGSGSHYDPMVEAAWREEVEGITARDEQAYLDSQLLRERAAADSAELARLRQEMQSQRRDRSIIDLTEVEESLICPLTGELFEDPVTTALGHTYERELIEMWLKDHNTDPMTNEELPHKNLIPSHALKAMAQTIRDCQQRAANSNEENQAGSSSSS
mgnify:FL=1